MRRSWVNTVMSWADALMASSAHAFIEFWTRVERAYKRPSSRPGLSPEVRVLPAAGHRRARMAGLGLHPRPVARLGRGRDLRPGHPLAPDRAETFGPRGRRRNRRLLDRTFPGTRRRRLALEPATPCGPARRSSIAPVCAPSATTCCSRKPRRRIPSATPRSKRWPKAATVDSCSDPRACIPTWTTNPARRRWRRRPVRSGSHRDAQRQSAHRAAAALRKGDVDAQRAARHHPRIRWRDPRHTAARAVRRLGVAVAAAAAGVERDRTRAGDVSRPPCASTGASIRNCRRSAPPTCSKARPSVAIRDEPLPPMQGPRRARRLQRIGPQRHQADAGGRGDARRRGARRGDRGAGQRQRDLDAADLGEIRARRGAGAAGEFCVLPRRTGQRHRRGVRRHQPGAACCSRSPA